MFFTSCDSDDEEYEFVSDDEEYELIMESKIPIAKLLVEGNVTVEPYKQILLGTLTWSIKNRLTTPEVKRMI